MKTQHPRRKPNGVMLSDYMVQVWEAGEWVDYWPVSVPGASRTAARRCAPRVFMGDYAKRYAAGKLRWKLGRCLRHVTILKPAVT